MAKTMVVASSLLVALLLTAAAALAQQPQQQQQPEMIRLITVHVQLGQQQRFESLIPKLWDGFKKVGVKSPIFVAAGLSDPSAYTFVVPTSSFADIGTQEELFGKAFVAVPEVTAEVFRMTTSIDDEIWAARTDLGYVPATPRVKMEEQMFGRIALLYVHPAEAAAFEAVLKERAALRKKHGINDGVEVAQLVIGADGPAYAVILGGKDEVDFYTQNAKNVEKMGRDWQASLEKSGTMLRRIEFATSSGRPALTYQP
jgi:hypothetical protein